MPVESATYISQLVPADPIHTDGVNQGDSHLRLIKTVLQAQFPNLGAAAVTATAGQIDATIGAFANPGVIEVTANGSTGGELKLDPPSGSGSVFVENTGTSGNPGSLAVVINDHTDANPITAMTLTQAGALLAATSLNAPSIQKAGNELLPTGVICMWSGSTTSIPAGWNICDGTNGTPDLRNMFVVGAGSTYAVAQTGGATSVTTVTDTQGAHSHTGNTASAGPWAMNGYTDVQGNHAHTGATGAYALTINDIPPHAHNYVVISDGGSGSQSGGRAGPPAGEETTDYTGGGAAHIHAISQDGAHAHTVFVNNAPAHVHAISVDGSHLHNITVATLPPFYALAFIMKL